MPIAQRTILWFEPSPLSLKTFLSSSATPIVIRPEELGIDLLRLYQIFQLFEARKRPVFKDVFRHINSLEQIKKLFRSAAGVPSASETRHMLANLLERHTVAPIILAGSSKTHTTVREHLAHCLRNLAHAIVLRSIANIEYFIVDCFGGSLQHCDNRTRNIQSMNQWPPRCPIAGHLDLPGRPCQPGQIVQYDVKSHSRRSAIGSGIAHEGRLEALPGEAFHVALNQGLAYCVSRSRINARLLSHIIPFRDTV